FRIVKGIEANIRSNGEVDVPEEVLAQLDWVVASIHQAREASPTERILSAMEHPHVDCIGHLTGRKITRRGPMDLDGGRVIEGARYLERVDELPVLAQVAPGEIRARLPASPPEQAEPFADVLRDLDEVLLPGITHWQHPRFFAYFATTASEPGILAELLVATL